MTLLAEIRLEKAALLLKHKYPHVQTGYLVSGRINLTIDDTTCQVAHGDSRCSHSNVEHLAVAQEDSIAVEALSPRREYYIP